MSSDDLLNGLRGLEGQSFPVPGHEGTSYTVHVGGESSADAADVRPSAPTKDAVSFDRTEMLDEGDGPDGDDDRTDREIVDDAVTHGRQVKRELYRRRVADAPFASALQMLCALQVARRAAPKNDTDEPALAFVVVASEPELPRILFSARDGNRWHTTFVPTSAPVTFPTMALTLEKIAELIDTLTYAAKRYHLANVRFRDASLSDLVWHVAHSAEDFVEVELATETSTPSGWRPPPFQYGGVDAAVQSTYDAKALTQATSWPPRGGATTVRDEIDKSGRKHIWATDAHGNEVLHAIVLPVGQTEGLPESRQTEINGTLSPPRSVSPDGQWRVERANVPGSGSSGGSGGFHTLRSGTETECREMLERARGEGAHVRLVTPAGSVVLEHAAAPASKAEAKRVGGPGKKAKANPIVHRGGKPGAKRGKGKG